MGVRQFPGTDNIFAVGHRQADDGHEQEHGGDYASESSFHRETNIARQQFFCNTNQMHKTFRSRYEITCTILTIPLRLFMPF